tara:strand:+ start:1866 stop:2057 length:192 start_codon:yes stop_codon:yes gene_type:complete
MLDMDNMELLWLLILGGWGLLTSWLVINNRERVSYLEGLLFADAGHFTLPEGQMILDDFVEEE